MEPVIQYAMTSDGVSIAFSCVGDGRPVVFLPILPLSHLQLEWQIGGLRDFYEHLAATHRLIRFDARGLGLSDRADSDRTLDAHVRDLEAVVDRLKLDRFAIFAASYSGPVGLRYAARHPDRVTRIMLWSTHAYHGDVIARLPEQLNQQRVAVNQLAGVDRDLYIRTYLHRAVGWKQGETANQFVEIAKQSIDPERFFENLANHAAFDAREDLPNVTCPALVMHRPAFVGSHVDVAKGLAARMPNARLLLLEGDSIVPFIGDSGEILQACLDFLQEDEGESGSPAADGAMRTMLYTDLESHSAMMQRLGDVRGREVLREHERIIREALRAHAGEELKTFGDGFLVSFGSTQMALRCAIALQRSFEALAPVHGERLRVRVGINAGEPIAERDALYGESVTVARQLAKAASGGEILVSLVVRELVAGKGFHFERRTGQPAGDQPAEWYALEWREAVAG